MSNRQREFLVRIDGSVSGEQVAKVLSRGGLDEDYFAVEEVSQR